MSVSRSACAAAFWAGGPVELGHLLDGRAHVDLHVFRQHHRQLVLRYRHVAAGRAVNDGDRATPVTLAGNAPVAQAPGGAPLAEAQVVQHQGDLVDGVFGGAAREVAGVEQHTQFDIGLGEGQGQFAFHRLDYRLDCQTVLLGEGEVPLVVGRHGHHRALAVAHQHVVGDEHRDGFVGEGVVDLEAGVHALLFHGGQVRLGHAALLAFVDEGGQRRIGFGCPLSQRVLGGDRHVSHAEQGVGPGGEHLQDILAVFVALMQGEMDLHAEALADPVALHGLDPLRPAGQVVQFAQQFFRIVGDAHEVHGDVALFHQGAGTPAAAVNDLLVGQHGVVHRVPVHRGHLLVDQAFLEQLGEQPLLPVVIVGLAGSQFARPVDGQAQRFQLLAHVIDVGISPAGRRHVVGHGGVLGGQAEGVPAHGLEHVKPLHAVVAGQHVADGVVAHVAHVQLPGRVREHGQAVVLGPGRVLRSAEDLFFLPMLLGFRFDDLRAVMGVHGSGSCVTDVLDEAADYTGVTDDTPSGRRLYSIG